MDENTENYTFDDYQTSQQPLTARSLLKKGLYLQPYENIENYAIGDLQKSRQPLTAQCTQHYKKKG